jgi:hypothetical protein
MMKAVQSAEDEVGALVFNAANDTFTIAVADGQYMEWYGTVFSGRASTTSTQNVEIRCSFAAQVGRAQLSIPATLVDGGWSQRIGPPPGTYIQGADGGNLSVVIDNQSAADQLNGLQTTTYYRLRNTVTGSG